MKKIIAENFEFVYDNDFHHGLSFYRQVYDSGEIYLAEDATKFISIEELSEVCRICVTIDNIRDIRNVIYIDYLYWFDKIDLKVIDEKVVTNNYLDDDFISSIKTYYVDKVSCFGCNHSFRALCVEPVLLYPTNFSLGETKRELLKKSNKVIKNCPICSERFTLTVVHIFI